MATPKKKTEPVKPAVTKAPAAKTPAPKAAAKAAPAPTPAPVPVPAPAPAPVAAAPAPKAKPAAKKAPAPAPKKVLTPEERYQWLRDAAYFIAEKNGFAGDDAAYWAEAERKLAAELG